MTTSIHDPSLHNPARLVVIQASVTPADDDHCAMRTKRCHQMNGHNEGGYTCPVFHRKLTHTCNPFRVRRLSLCRRGEERNEELTRQQP